MRTPFRRTSPVAILAAVAILTLMLAAPAGAITDGVLDDGDHPHVGLMIAKNADNVPMWRCSGTLLTETVFLTAGHCTDGAAFVEIWFEDGPIPLGAGYPATTPGDPCDGITGYPCTGDASGTPHTHPAYNPGTFFLRDVGVVLLDDPFPVATYGLLPQADQLDQLQTRRGKQNVFFRAVGYGLQRVNPVFLEGIRVRMVSNPHLIQLNAPGFTGDFSLLLSNNKRTGGTCFGDSGGPNFIAGTDVIAGVTSYGLNGNCAGTGGVYRLDRSWNLDWLSEQFGVTP